ncbi:MAG: ArsR/SmtB family transcription factor [Cellulomonadaceae bacterium]
MNADYKCSLGPESAYVELAVEVFSMLADATRVRIILALRDQELPVNSLAELVDKSPAAVSQHLAKLRLARIVLTRQEGTKVFYRLANEHARQLVADAIFQAEHSLSSDPAHHRGGHPAPEETR